jgi:hypothetical protein
MAVLFPRHFYSARCIQLALWHLSPGSQPALLQWLLTRRTDGEPRMFLMEGTAPLSFLEQIREVRAKENTEFKNLFSNF